MVLGLGRALVTLLMESFGESHLLDTPVGDFIPRLPCRRSTACRARSHYTITYHSAIRRIASPPIATPHEMFLEGVVLFIILNIFVRKNRPMGSVSGLFLIGYGAFRIIVEFFRQPFDAQLGLFSGISMGQILSIPMIILGIIFYGVGVSSR